MEETIDKKKTTMVDTAANARALSCRQSAFINLHLFPTRPGAW
jgi:hypothetical protein